MPCFIASIRSGIWKLVLFGGVGCLLCGTFLRTIRYRSGKLILGKPILSKPTEVFLQEQAFHHHPARRSRGEFEPLLGFVKAYPFVVSIGHSHRS